MFYFFYSFFTCRTADTPMADEPPSKVAKKDGAGTAHNQAAGATDFIHRPVSNFKTRHLKFNHHRFMWTCGYQFKHLTGKTSGRQEPAVAAPT